MSMYLTHFGLNEPPFRITPHTEFFFAGANRGETLEALLYAITHDEGIVKVTGEVGSGKTMLCRMLIERLPDDVETVYLANPSFSRDEILLALLDDLNCPVTGDQRSSLVIKVLQSHLIERYASSKRVVLLIDEAHAMPEETLDEIRLLSNLESNRHKLLQIVLFGQQELDDNLSTSLLRPLRERITHSFRLEPLIHADVGKYLMFRLRQADYRGPDLFDQEALRLIAKSSEGLTRRLNILADKCLLAAFTEGDYGITAKHAKAAIRDSGFSPLGRRGAGLIGTSWRRSALALIGVLLVAGGVGVGMKLSGPPDGQGSQPKAAASPAPQGAAAPRTDLGATPVPGGATTPSTGGAAPIAAVQSNPGGAPVQPNPSISSPTSAPQPISSGTSVDAGISKPASAGVSPGNSPSNHNSRDGTAPMPSAKSSPQPETDASASNALRSPISGTSTPKSSDQASPSSSAKPKKAAENRDTSQSKAAGSIKDELRFSPPKAPTTQSSSASKSGIRAASTQSEAVETGAATPTSEPRPPSRED